MSRRRLAPTALLAALIAALVAGCGGSSTVATGGAGVVPAGTAAFVAINTDTESGQWQAAEALLGKFPDRDRLLAMFERELSKENLDYERDVKPAVGPEVDVAVLDADSASPHVVVLTQPKDEAKLDALVAKSDEPLVKEEIGGWTVLAEKQSALDQLKSEAAGGTLEGSGRFQEATSSLDEGALVRFYVDGTQLADAQRNAGPAAGPSFLFGDATRADWISGTLEANGDGVVVRGSAKGADLSPTTYKADLVSDVPASAVAYVSFDGLDDMLRKLRNTAGNSVPGLDQQIAQFEAAASLSLDEDVFPLFAREGALFVTPARPIPAFTLVVEVDDEQAAMNTLDRLVGFVGRPEPISVAGVDAHELPIQEGFRLIYGTFDGRLVVTTAEEGISGLRSDGPKLADDATFRDAVAASGMPDETGGWLYVDGQGLAQMLYGLVGASGVDVPDEVRRNVEPLKSLITYAAQDGDVSTFTVLLRIQ